ncbi:MAG: DUF4258 domain-containing protein [Flavobacterium sp.]|nr:DUF4258 domain-containing protein [Flavobacterium sp.]
MGFKYRLAYYLVGLVIGCFFVAMVFQGKDTRCNYFPNARVLNDLRNKPFYYSEEASKALADKVLDSADVKKILTHGDIDFDLSNVPYQNGKLYVIEGRNYEDRPITVEVVNYSDKAMLKTVKIN